MTGSIYSKKMRSGKTYLYVKLNYRDYETQTWKQKHLPTGLLAKGNKKKANEMIPKLIEEYAYLELPPDLANHSIDQNILFCDYLDRWLEQKKVEIRQTTYEGYTVRVEAIKKYFKKYNYRVKDITSRIIDAYLRHELAYGKTNQKTGEKEGLSVRSVRSRKCILVSVFDQAMIDTLVNHNPAKAIRISKKANKEFNEEELFLTEEEIAKLMAFLSEKYPKLLPIAFMATFFGLRRSEILGLKWSSIDFEKKTVSINRTVVRLTTTMETDTTKTKNSKRTLTLFSNAELCFKKIKETQDEYKDFFGSAYKNDKDYIFTHEDGSPYDPDLISKQFKDAFAAFGRPELSLHKLRHSCASMAIDRGWSVKQTQYWLGHADVQTTLDIYAHYDKHKLNTSEKDLDDMSSKTVHLFQ